jgi:hypothetical protein
MSKREMPLPRREFEHVAGIFLSHPLDRQNSGRLHVNREIGNTKVPPRRR